MRKFRCIGLEAIEVDCWTNYFSIDKIYVEYERLEDKTLLKLIDKDGDDMYVDADCFEQVFEGTLAYDLDQLVSAFNKLSDEGKEQFKKLINYEKI